MFTLSHCNGGSKMVNTAEYTGFSVEEKVRAASNNLSLTLKKAGIHNAPPIELQVYPPTSEDEIAELQAHNLINEGTEISESFGTTTIRLDEANEVSQEHENTAIAIAKTLAAKRDLDSAVV